MTSRTQISSGGQQRLDSWARGTPFFEAAHAALVAVAEHTETPAVEHWANKAGQRIAWGAATSARVRDFWVGDPSAATALKDGPFARDEGLVAHCATVLEAFAKKPRTLLGGLRRLRQAVWADIVGGVAAEHLSIQEATEAFSILAVFVLETLVKHYRAEAVALFGPELPSGGIGHFCILAQGKLGAFSLNASSDIDIQFIYQVEPHAAEEGERLSARFLRLAQRVIEDVQAKTSDGFLYRVDLDLRPEGQSGRLLHSVLALEIYYSGRGAAWERLALMRARPVAGDKEAGLNLCRRVATFVYPRAQSLSIVQAVGEVYWRTARPFQSEKADLKRTPGGIRHIELFVQLLQHLLGGRDKTLQTSSLTTAVLRLREAGHLTSLRADALMRHYWLLRRVEHACQADGEQQVYELPEDPKALHRVAAASGFASAQDLLVALAQARRRTMRLTHALLPRPDLSPPVAVSERSYRARAWQALHTTGQKQRRALLHLGFVEPEAARSVIAHLAQKPKSLLFKDAGDSAYAWLSALGQSPRPNHALALWADLEPALAGHADYVRALRARGPLRRKTADLLGASNLLGRLLIRHPALMDFLLRPSRSREALRLGPPDDWVQELKLPQAESPLSDDAVTLALRRLCRQKDRALFAIGLSFLSGSCALKQIHLDLTRLAEWVLTVAVALAARLARLASLSGIAVVALGQMGTRRMNFGSDLDLVFLVDNAESDHVARGTRFAQKLLQVLTLHLPEGQLFPVDVRLRPSGSQGILVTSAGAFFRHHRETSAVWERQALFKGRVVAGDDTWWPELARQLEAAKYVGLFELRARHPAKFAEMRAALLPIARKDSFDLKMGRGGLLELDFGLQYLQLAHAETQAALRTSETDVLIAVLKDLGFVDAQTATALLGAYQLLDSCAQALRLREPQPQSRLFWRDDEISAVSRALLPHFPHDGPRALRRKIKEARSAVNKFYIKAVTGRLVPPSLAS